jgi:hypothetical protein
MNVITPGSVSSILHVHLAGAVSFPPSPRTGTRSEVVETGLDHAHDNNPAMSDDRGERFDQRVQPCDWWGERRAAAQRGAKIIPLPEKAMA